MKPILLLFFIIVFTPDHECNHEYCKKMEERIRQKVVIKLNSKRWKI